MYTFNAVSVAEDVAHRYQSQELVICLAAGHSPSFNILASMISGVLPTGKFEGRQQLRQEAAHVCVFADHPPAKLEGITQVTRSVMMQSEVLGRWLGVGSGEVRDGCATTASNGEVMRGEVKGHDWWDRAGS